MGPPVSHGPLRLSWAPPSLMGPPVSHGPLRRKCNGIQGLTQPPSPPSSSPLLGRRAEESLSLQVPLSPSVKGDQITLHNRGV